MDSTASVSKGCFIFNALPKKQKRNQKAGEPSFHKERWYTAYRSLWNSIENKLQRVHSDVYSEMLKELVDYVELSQEPSNLEEGIPVATLLTGMNMPDHVALFDQLCELLHDRVTPHVATLHARNCNTIRATIEQIVSQLVSGAGRADDDDEDEQQTSDAESSGEENKDGQLLKKHQCNFTTLEAWYRELLENNLPLKSEENAEAQNSNSPKIIEKLSECNTPTKAGKTFETEENALPTNERRRVMRGSPTKRSSSAHLDKNIKPVARKKIKTGRPIIVIVIPEFESFNATVLQTLMSIVSCKYPVVPMTFVLGVATSVHVMQCRLSYHIAAKLRIRIFSSEKSITFLNLVLERIFLTSECPFLLGGKTFRLFCEVFLFYDFSVDAFVQNFKFCMLEHFFGRDINSLCCTLDDLDSRVEQLTSADSAQLRKLPSFLAYEEKCTKSEKEILIYGSNIAFKKVIRKMVQDLHNHSSSFYVMLQVLNVFCSSLPTAPLGKHIRKLYESSITDAICDSKEYKECFKMLGLQSRDELMEKLEKVTVILTLANSRDEKPFVEVISQLQVLATLLGNAGMTIAKSTPKSPTKSSSKGNSARKKMSRSQFLSNMKASCSKQDLPLTEYEVARENLINYLTAMFPKFLTPLTTFPLHELVLFDNVGIVKKHIIGSPRAAIHMALNNPHYYLQCDCCVLPTHSEIQSSLPDVCIAYKLHLECGKLINLYDWLQAFASVVNTTNDANGQISPEIQARFATSVSELQLLGFIMTTKKKADHVSRLTLNPR